MTTRRALLCALPALPFVAKVFGRPFQRTTIRSEAGSVTVKIEGRVLRADDTDWLVDAIRDAVEGHDVVLLRR